MNKNAEKTLAEKLITLGFLIYIAVSVISMIHIIGGHSENQRAFEDLEERFKQIHNNQDEEETCGLGCAIAEASQNEWDMFKTSKDNIIEYFNVTEKESEDLYFNKSSFIHDSDCAMDHCFVMWSDGRCALMEKEYMECVIEKEDEP